MATLGLVWGLLWLTNQDEPAEVAAAGTATRIGTTVTLAGLEAGDCMNFGAGNRAASEFRLVDCDDPHGAQVTGIIEHPDANDAFPGADAIAQWLGDDCETQNEIFLGAPVLTTTLDEGVVLPDLTAWSSSGARAACYLAKVDNTSLTASVEGMAQDHLRGETVVVARLLEGDCFRPQDGTTAYDLNSNSVVSLVSCEEAHNGVFFGRATLDYDRDAEFPGDEEVGEATSRTCSSLFADHFGKESAGFNYRYWRPNTDSWELADRTVLCSILDTESLVSPFDPADYERFFDLQVGTCFNLGPEESPDTLRLDDQVRVVSCDDLHIGQMIGSGRLDVEAGEPFPVDNGVLELAGGECEDLFEAFVGVSPYESDYGNFPFWYPNEAGWDDDDRRYACAFLEDEPRAGTFEDASA